MCTLRIGGGRKRQDGHAKRRQNDDGMTTHCDISSQPGDRRASRAHRFMIRFMRSALASYIYVAWYSLRRTRNGIAPRAKLVHGASHFAHEQFSLEIVLEIKYKMRIFAKHAQTRKRTGKCVGAFKLCTLYHVQAFKRMLINWSPHLCVCVFVFEFNAHSGTTM